MLIEKNTCRPCGGTGKLMGMGGMQVECKICDGKGKKAADQTAAVAEVVGVLPTPVPVITPATQTLELRIPVDKTSNKIVRETHAKKRGRPAKKA